jgi:monoamine oxidase
LGWPRPIELGAEFIHGGSRAIRATLKKGRIKIRPIEPNMWFYNDGLLKPMKDFWERIGNVADRIPKADHGWSFHEFINRQARYIPPEDRALAEAYVGSFNAALTREIAAHAVRAHRAGADTEDHKIVGRYDLLVGALKKQWPARRVDVHLKTVATNVSWHRGQVAVRTCSMEGGKIEQHHGRALVITLPIGVLKAGKVVFSPRLAAKQSLFKRIGWGHVVRLIIRFRLGFWSAPFIPKEVGAGQGRAFGFINAPSESVPVWWALDAPIPILTGWAGGEIADRFERATPQDILNQALTSLSHIFNVPEREMKSWMLDWTTHDWRHDPFALGAYSFPTAGHENIPEELSRPIQDTLFFAGEALSDDYGTVHGAMNTGLRAAHELIKALC